MYPYGLKWPLGFPCVRQPTSWPARMFLAFARMKHPGRGQHPGLAAGLLQWALDQGEAQDYTANLPVQCLHPMGHFYEVPNLLLNGTLRLLLQERLLMT